MQPRFIAKTAAALVIAATAATPALADTVVLHGYQWGPKSFDLWINSTHKGATDAGRFFGELNGGPANSFTTFCTDLAEAFNWNVTYSNYYVANFTPAVAANLGKLFTTHIADVNINDSYKEARSAAFQMAVWELFYDTDMDVSTVGGQFYTTTVAVATPGNTSGYAVTLANQWLDDVAATSTTMYSVKQLKSDGHQDFLVTAPVPEPETYAMFLAGLGLMGFVARRRSQRA